MLICVVYYSQIAGDLAETEGKFAASRESLHEYDEQIAPIEVPDMYPRLSDIR